MQGALGAPKSTWMRLNYTKETRRRLMIGDAWADGWEKRNVETLRSDVVLSFSLAPFFSCRFLPISRLYWTESRKKNATYSRSKKPIYRKIDTTLYYMCWINKKIWMERHAIYANVYLLSRPVWTFCRLAHSKLTNSSHVLDEALAS